MPSTATEYDVFISYARKDNAPIPATYPRGWVTAIYEHILADHRRYSTAPLRIFFDTHELHDGDKWWPRILAALRHSKMLLVCLSPNYFASEYCRREWKEYADREVHRLIGSEGVLPIYFIEAPGTPELTTAEWRKDVLEGDQSRNWVDLHPWFPEGAEALQKADVRTRMDRLGITLWERIERARRAMAVPGNLRWQNPHFVGRREELRKLHENLGTGAVGVVTAVQGLGGQGKTELAVAYAHGWADCYPGGLWSLGAEGAKELLPLIGNLAWERALGFTPTEAEKNDPALLGRGVLEHLKQRSQTVAQASRLSRPAGILPDESAPSGSKPAGQHGLEAHATSAAALQSRAGSATPGLRLVAAGCTLIRNWRRCMASWRGADVGRVWRSPLVWWGRTMSAKRPLAPLRTLQSRAGYATPGLRSAA